MPSIFTLYDISDWWLKVPPGVRSSRPKAAVSNTIVTVLDPLICNWLLGATVPTPTLLLEASMENNPGSEVPSNLRV